MFLWIDSISSAAVEQWGMEAKVRLADGSRQRAIPRKIHFTEAKVRRIECPPGKTRIYVYDDDVGALALQVMSTGRRSFYFYRKANGLPVKKQIGTLDKMTVAQARQRVTELNSLYNKGIDAVAEERKRREAGTLGDLWNAYKAKKLDVKATAKTIRSEVSLYNTTLEPWAGRHLHAIDHDACADLHATIGEERGERTANRALKMLSRLYAWHGTPAPFNTRRIDWFKERSRERILEEGELRRLMAAIEAEGGDVRDALLLGIFTGARRDNVASMRWDELDLESNVWTVPGEKSKNRDDMLIPLTPAALEIIKARHALSKVTPYVFPRPGDPDRHIPGYDVWKRFAAIRQAAKVSDVYVHDLRHLLGSTMSDATGSNLQIVGKALGHKSTESTKVYARPRMAAVRAAMTAATEAILEASKQKGEDTKKVE